MLTLALAAFFLFITPGPGVLSTAGVGAAYGYRPGVHYLSGLFVGNNLVSLAVASGLAAALLANPNIRTVLLVLSAGYLLYLAFRIAFSGSRIAFIGHQKPPGFINGILLQAINPKAYAVHTTFFSGFAFWPESFLVETIIKFAILNVIWIPIHVGWLAAGVTVRRLNLSPRIQFTINIVMALLMLGVVALAAFASHQG